MAAGRLVRAMDVFCLCIGLSEAFMELQIVHLVYRYEL